MSHNTWIHRGVRAAVRPLVRTPVTPNHLTALRLVTGIAAAAAYAVGTEATAVAGSIAFIVSMLLDRADGELARLSGRHSEFGHKFDLVTDATCNALVFVGIGFGAASSPLGVWAPALGVLAGAAVAAVLWLMVRAEAREGRGAAALQSFAGFDADDAIVVVPLAMLAGWSVPLLIAAAVGAPAFALLFGWREWRRVRRASPAEGL